MFWAFSLAVFLIKLFCLTYNCCYYYPPSCKSLSLIKLPMLSLTSDKLFSNINSYNYRYDIIDSPNIARFFFNLYCFSMNFGSLDFIYLFIRCYYYFCFYCWIYFNLFNCCYDGGMYTAWSPESSAYINSSSSLLLLTCWDVVLPLVFLPESLWLCALEFTF